jgi:hypothetical protein
LTLFTLALSLNRGDMWELGERIHNAWKPLAVAMAFGVFGLAMLFFATAQDGHYYWQVLFFLSQKLLPMQMWIEFFIDFMTYWPSYAHNYFVIESGFSGAILFRLAAAMFASFCVGVAIHEQFLSTYPRARTWLLLSSFGITIAMFLLVRNEWAGHHFVFLWVPLILLFADFAVSLSPGLCMAVISSFLALNLWSVIALTQYDVRGHTSIERYVIFDYFSNKDIASQAVINFTSWGAYYMQAIYGPRGQLVLYTEPHVADYMRTGAMIPEDAAQVTELVQKTGRRLYNVCSGNLCNKAALEAAFNYRFTFEDALPGLTYWHVFAATQRKN